MRQTKMTFGGGAGGGKSILQAMLCAAAGVAMTPAKVADELVGTKGVDKIAADQRRAAQAKRQMKISRRNAANALVEVSQEQLVLGYIHPRWLRTEVERLMDAGQDVTREDVDRMRKEGPPRCTCHPNYTTQGSPLEAPCEFCSRG